MDLVFIYLSITVFIFVLALTVSSLLLPTSLTPVFAYDPSSLWALPLLQEMLRGMRGGAEAGGWWRARNDMLLGMCTWAQVALLGMTLSQG